MDQSSADYSSEDLSVEICHKVLGWVVWCWGGEEVRGGWVVWRVWGGGCLGDRARMI